MHLF